MKRLLMIESWCKSSGILLPKKIRELGHRYIFVTRCPELYQQHALQNGQHPVLAYADAVVVCDTNHIDTLIETVDGLKNEYSFDGVITNCDFYLCHVALIAQHLGLPGNPISVMRQVVNKYYIRQTLAKKGLTRIRFHAAENLEEAHRYAEEIGYPIIVKPADSCASTMVRKVTHPSQLESAISLIFNEKKNFRDQPCFAKPLLEEFIKGEELSVEAWVFKGSVHIVGMTDKRLGGTTGVVECAHGHPVNLPEKEANAIRTYVEDCLNALSYENGVAHVEVKRSPTGPEIVEINPRLGGNDIAKLMELTHGVSPLELMVEIALGRHPEVSVSPKNTSAAIYFWIAAKEGTLREIRGMETLTQQSNLHEYEINVKVGDAIQQSIDNNYLGYVICTDPTGFSAHHYAQNARNTIQFEIG